MATDGNIITKLSTPWRDFTAETAGLGLAEMVSIGVSLGVVGIADQVAPGLIKQCSKTVGKVIEPYLDHIENGLQKVCKLEECQPDKNLPRQERAENLAKTIIVFSSAWAMSMAAKIITRKVFNDFAGVKGEEIEKTGNKLKDFMNQYVIPNKHDRHVFYWDEGVHYGSLLLLNTGLAKNTDDMIRSTSRVLQKCGMGKKKADELSAMGVIWELPNVLGWMAGAARIGYQHFAPKAARAALSHTEQLAQSSALTSTMPTRTP